MKKILLTTPERKKHWANTWTEIEELGKGKFGATIHVGHQVFKDKADGLYKKHKLTDGRPGKDYILVQSAKCCVEIYPYYAKYFDVNHEEVRLHEERWVVQRLFKAPDKWRDVDAYNPVISVEEYSEPAGDVVKIIVTYDTDYGELVIEYLQRDGNALKHNINFKNTSGGVETFRVLQRWSGIVADKINGEEIIAPIERLKYGFRFEKAGKFQIKENLNSLIPTQQDKIEADRKMWIRHGTCNRCGKCCLSCSHYDREHPKCDIYETRPDLCREFPWEPEQIEKFPECSYSFEATEVIAFPTKLQPTILDKHPKGLKADFVYGNWILAQDENLEVDPNTATLDDPTEDGQINGYDATANRVNDGSTIRMGYYAKLEIVYRGYIEWNISSIPDEATITDVIFKYHGFDHVIDCHIHEMLGCQPSEQPDDDTGNVAIFNEAGEGTIYAEPDGFPEVGANKQVDLGASADSDLQSQLTDNWFAIGIQSDNEGLTSNSYILSEEATVEIYPNILADPKPTLYVEYSVGWSHLWNTKAIVKWCGKVIKKWNKLE